MTRSSTISFPSQRGIALPTALFLMLVIVAVGAIYTRTSTQTMRAVSLDQSARDAFNVAEGAAHDVVRRMSVHPNLWINTVSLSAKPAGYTEYSPLAYLGSNGIPNCSGSGCQRHLYPLGGGLIKNFGPTGGDGASVDTSLEITRQLNPEDPPEEDLSLNGRPAWAQVERLDETTISPRNLGGDLANNPVGGASVNIVRFRVTGQAVRRVRERVGRSTVVVVVEVPSA